MIPLTSEDAARTFVASRCPGGDLKRIEAFVDLLAHANQRQNLVSRGSFEQVWLRHIADSAQLLDHVPSQTALWVDLGSGAGFPGLIAAIMQPARPFILIESRSLRVQWLAKVIEQLKITNCAVVGEDVRRVKLSKADVISARAFAPLDRLIAQSARFSTATTAWVLPKGRSASQEVAALPPAQRLMFHVKQSVTDRDAGIVVGTGKVEITP